jgi:hypothetical protein
MHWPDALVCASTYVKYGGYEKNAGKVKSLLIMSTCSVLQKTPIFSKSIDC